MDIGTAPAEQCLDATPGDTYWAKVMALHPWPLTHEYPVQAFSDEWAKRWINGVITHEEFLAGTEQERRLGREHELRRAGLMTSERES